MTGSGPRSSRGGGCGIELLEQRRLLAASITNVIPAVFMGTAPQTPLGDSTTLFSFTAGFTTSAMYFRFATDDAVPGATTSIYTNTATMLNGVDAGIAIFDADGNLLKTADADASPGVLNAERLDISLTPRTPYIVGVYSLASLSPLDIAFALPQQKLNAALKLDPATGTTSLDAAGGEDTYNTPADPDYFPLNFFNGRGTGVVSVSPIGLDVNSTIGVLQQVPQSTLVWDSRLPGDTAWRTVGTATGPTATVNVAPASGQNLSDAKYLLSTAPTGLSSPARAYHIDVSAGTLAPASIEGTVPVSLGALLPATLGQASVTKLHATGTGAVYSFIAAATGPLILETNGPQSGTTMALYDATGSTLLAAGGRTTGVSYSMTVDVVAGTTYLLRSVGTTVPNQSLTLVARQPYTPEALSLNSGAVVQPGLTIGGTAGAKYYRVAIPTGTDVLSIRIAPQDSSGGTTTLRVIGANIAAPVTRTAAAGAPLNAVLDSRTFGREIDLAITADNAAGVEFSVAPITVAKTLGAATPFTTIDLVTGDASRSGALGGAGDVQAMQFWAINTGTTSIMTATGTSGALPIVAQYEDRDGALRLVDFAVPNVAGVAQRVTTINPGRRGAVAAISARPDGSSGNVQVAVDGARPIGVGIAMSPEPLPQFQPTDPVPVAPFTTNLRIRNVTLRSPQQRDLWETSVPLNISAAPRLTIKPVTAGGSIALRVRVMDVNNTVLATITTAPGQQINEQALSSISAASIAGQKLRFLVESVGANIGDGIYTLEFRADTTNPIPFQVIEPTFNFGYAQNTPSFPNFETIRSVTVNSFADSSFTSSTPYNTTTNGSTGSIDIFRFTHGPTPFAVQTEDLTTGVNTNIKLYRGRGAAGNPTALDAVPGTSHNFDYFPADRSTVDARIEMWNTDLARDTFNGASYEPGRNVWYVVVKNEAGSQGNYRLRVSDLTPQAAGPGATPAYFGYGGTEINIDPRTATGTASFISGGVLQRVTTPSTVGGFNTMNVTVSRSSGSAGTRTYRLDVFDASGSLMQTSNLSGANSVTFGVSNIFSNSTYFIRTFVVSGGDVPMTLALSTTLGSASAAVKPGAHQQLTSTGSFSAPAELYDRANQFADGTFTSVSPFIPTGTGLKHKVVFWVDQPGTATFTLSSSGTVSSRTLGLWRGDKIFGEPVFYVGGELKDFSSTTQANGTIVLQTPVLPGMYYLTVDATTSASFARVTIAAQLPLPHSTLITLDPNSGSTSAENQNRVDPVVSNAYPLEINALEDFRTSFYKVVTPGGSQAGLISAAAVYSPPPAANLNEGRAYVSITRLTGSTLTYTGTDSSINLDGSTDDLGAIVTATDLALPNTDYYIAVNRDRMLPADPSLHISAQYTVPQSGTPDIVVDRVRFDPANGRTLVSIDLRNNGYATAGAFKSRLHFSNFPVDSVFTIPGFGPLASQTVSYLWDPTNGTDTVTYTADIDNIVAERNEGNNVASAALNKSRPVIASFALTDAQLDADADPNVWGRYVATVLGASTNIVVTPTDADGQADIYRTFYSEPRRGSNRQITYTGGGPFTRADFDFGDLAPTSAANLNRFSVYVQDQWGLISDTKFMSANVVPKSSFFTTMKFDRASHTYSLDYGYSIVNYDKTLSEILGFEVPLVGDKRTKFILRFGAFGTATLNPATSISLPLGAELNITAFDYELYKLNLGGGTKINDNLMIGASLEVPGKTLDVSAVGLSLQLRNLKLLDLDTGKIRLFSFGIPKVASISANFRFALKAGISAGLKVGLNPAILADPLGAPLRAGIMSPTFVQPKITGAASISGDVEVLGFDVADLEGHIGLGLNVTVGLDNNDTAKVFTLDEFIDRIKFDVSGDLNFGLSAHVWGLGEVWSWEPDPITFQIGGNTEQGIITDDPALPGIFRPAPSIGGGNANMIGSAGRGAASQPIVKIGSDIIGAYELATAPQLVIDPITGNALSIQVADSDPSAEQTRGELQFTSRADTAAAWSALAPIPGAADVANPVLVATNIAATPNMVVYEAVELPGNTQDQTFNDRLAARDLRYRTWDGEAWSDEFVLAGGSGGDSNHAVAFAPDGTGVAAWVHNDAAVQMDEQGNYARDAQEIQVALWDSATQSWLPGETLTVDSVVDSRPAVFAENGKAYAVWMRESGDGNELMFSTNDGSGWTTAAPLSIPGLDAGGVFTSVALGSEAPGRVNVLFNYRVQNADRSLDSVLYNRPSTSADFASAVGAEAVARDTNFSNLRTTNMPDGALVVSWKAGDGVTNEIFAAQLSAGAAWSKPMQLTQGDTIEQRQSVAVEPDGTLEVLYEVAEAGTGDAPAENPPPMAAGAGGTTARALPEVGFNARPGFRRRRSRGGRRHVHRRRHDQEHRLGHHQRPGRISPRPVERSNRARFAHHSPRRRIDF